MNTLGNASLSLALIVGFAFNAVLVSANMSGEESPPSEEPNYVDGRKALENKDYKAAIEKLSKAAEADKGNADIHNYLGFAYRNAGDLENAFKHYKKALALSPGHRGANEYIGEAYLMTNDVAKAEEHLNKLRSICVTGCAELNELKEKIDAHKKTKG